MYVEHRFHLPAVDRRRSQVLAHQGHRPLPEFRAAADLLFDKQARLSWKDMPRALPTAKCSPLLGQSRS